METSRPLTALHLRFAQFLKLTLGVLVMLPAVSGAAVVEYELRVLDMYVSPTDLNDSGWVVGQNWYDVSAVLRAGRSRTLVSCGGANAVNNAGVVLGERTDTTGRHAFRTTPAQSEVIEDLGLLPGGTYSVATAINATGDAVGYANVMASGAIVEQVVAFPAGQQEPKSLGHLPSYGGVAASASGINDGGDIAIYSYGDSLVISPRRPRPVVQYYGLPLLRAPIAGDAFGSALAKTANASGRAATVHCTRESVASSISRMLLSVTDSNPTYKRFSSRESASAVGMVICFMVNDGSNACVCRFRQ